MAFTKGFISMKMRNGLTLLLCLSICLFPCALAFAASAEDELVLGIVSTTTATLNPLEPIERDFASIYDICYDSLIEIDDDYRPKGNLAESWEETNNGKTWRFTLKEGITFSDGTPLTPNDVVATTHYILQKAGAQAEEGQEPLNKGYYQNLSYFVDSASVVDDRTVEFKAKRNYYGFLYALVYPILPADKLEMENPPGTGAYVVSAFEPQEYVWLQVNPNWWQTPPQIKQIMVICHTNNKDLINSYEYSRVDAFFTRNISASQYKTGVSSVSLDYRSRQLEMLFVNHSDQALKSLNVRKAVRHAINVDQIIQQVYMGMADRADTPILPNSWLSKEYASAFEYNPALAMELLEAEGWIDYNGDGIRDLLVGEETKHLHLRFLVYEEADNDVRVATANAISDMLSTVGISANVTMVNYQDMQARLKARSYDLALCSVNMDPVQDPGFLLMTNNTLNFCKYSNKTLDEQFKTLRSSVSAEAYRDALYSIQDIYAEDYPIITLFYRKGVVVSRKMYTLVRQVRELELLRGVDVYGQ